MKYRFRTQPYRHQVRPLKLALRNGRAALFMEMGTGKTWVAINWAAATAVRENPRAPAVQALVLCPKAVIGVWHKEIAKHDPFADNELMGVGWRIHNYEWAWRPHNYDELVDWMLERKTLLILDESHKIKTPTARRSRAAHRLARYAAGVVLATGTPITRSRLDLFSQYRALDPSIFGDSYSAFRRRYAKTSYMFPNKVLGHKRTKELKAKIKPVTYVVTKEECLDLPDRTHEVVPIQLAGRSLATYTRMARAAIAELDGVVSEAPLVLTRLLRLQQITGGWLHGDEGARRVGTEKKAALRELLENMREQRRLKVAVACRFLPELKDIAHACHDAGYKVLLMHGGVSQDRRERVFAAFAETNTPTVFACQISTGALGRNELVVAHEAISYSLTFSMDDFQQWLDRFHRPGQTHKVTYYHLVADGTVDEAVLLALRSKRDVARLIVKHPELILKRKEK